MPFQLYEAPLAMVHPVVVVELQLMVPMHPAPVQPLNVLHVAAAGGLPVTDAIPFPLHD